MGLSQCSSVSVGQYAALNGFGLLFDIIFEAYKLHMDAILVRPTEVPIHVQQHIASPIVAILGLSDGSDIYRMAVYGASIIIQKGLVIGLVCMSKTEDIGICIPQDAYQALLLPVLEKILVDSSWASMHQE